MPQFQDLLDQLTSAGAWVVIGQIALVLVVTFVALRFAHTTVRVALARLFAREVAEGTAKEVSAAEIGRRRATLDALLYRALRVIILIIAFLMVLQVLRLDIGPAIAGLGIVGLAISLGSQDLVRDYVAGAFVLIENQYARGDIVEIAGVTGMVEDVSLRRTSLRDLDGTLHTVPHSLIQVTSNFTRNWARINLDIPVPYEEDLDRVTEVINRAGKEMADSPDWKAKVLDAPHVVRVERLAETGIIIKVLGTVTGAHHFDASGEIRGRILAACSRDGLVIGWRTVPDRLASPRRRPPEVTE